MLPITILPVFHNTGIGLCVTDLWQRKDWREERKGKESWRRKRKGSLRQRRCFMVALHALSWPPPQHTHSRHPLFAPALRNGVGGSLCLLVPSTPKVERAFLPIPDEYSYLSWKFDGFLRYVGFQLSRHGNGAMSHARHRQSRQYIWRLRAGSKPLSRRQVFGSKPYRYPITGGAGSRSGRSYHGNVHFLACYPCCHRRSVPAVLQDHQYYQTTHRE